MKPKSDQQLPSSKPARNLLRTVLFFAGSAVFGGLAVALWDRKSLAAIRRNATFTPPPQSQADDEFE